MLRKGGKKEESLDSNFLENIRKSIMKKEEIWNQALVCF